MDILSILLEVSIYALVIFGAVVLMKKVLGKKMSAMLHYTVWALLIVRLMIPVTIDSGLKLFVIPQTQTQQQAQALVSEHDAEGNAVQQVGADNASPTGENDNSAIEADSVAISQSGAVVTPPSKTEPAFSVNNILITIWLGGVGIALVYIASCYVVLKRRIRRSAAAVTNHVLALFEECKVSMGIGADIQVLSTNGISTPALLIPSTILIPLDHLVSMSDRQIKYALSHELMHYKRKDHIVSALLIVLQAVYWFNPFIWLAFKQIRTDMEVACDSMVAKRLDAGEKSDYANMIVSMFSRSKGRQFVLGMAQGNTRKVAEKRVRGVFMNSVSKRGVKLVSTLLASLLLVTCFTTACQPTPDEPVVMNKNTDLVAEVQEAVSSAGEGELTEDKQTIAEQINAADGNLTMQITPSDQVTIDVDANIVIPEYDRLPMVRLKPKNFSKEQFDKFIDYLTGGLPVVYSPMTDEKCDKTIEEINEVLTKMKGYAANDELPSHMMSHINHIIEFMTDDLENAISKEDERPYDGTLTQHEDNRTYNTITQLKCYMDKDIAAVLALWQSFEGNETQMTFFNSDYSTAYNTFEPYEGVDAARIDMSYDEAKEKVEEFVRILDGEDSNLVIYDSSICYQIETFLNYTMETSPQAYNFKIARDYNGVTVKPENYLFGDPNKNIDYSKQVHPETFSVTVDDSGIIDACWANQVEYVENILDDVPLKDFDEIREIFENYCRYKFAWTYRNDALAGNTTPSVTFNVKRMEMNLMVVPEKDNLESYITVPVWDFIADMSIDEDAICQDGYMDEGQKDVSILTINAIDGSVIDREQGY